MVPVRGEVEREQRVGVRPVAPVPDRVSDKVSDPPESGTVQGFPCYMSEV